MEVAVRGRWAYGLLAGEKGMHHIALRVYEAS